MRVVVLSDTHIPDRCDALTSSVSKELKKADLIIHAGDFTSLEYYQQLGALKPLKAVLGNLDCVELQEILKVKEVFKIEHVKVGLIHGFGRPEDVLENVKKSFDDTFDLIIFGHTHKPFNEKSGRTLFFNPGSPTDKIFTRINSYGIIEVGKTIDARIISL